MDDKEVGRYWNGNAEVWTRLARAGYDVYRDYLNTPAFLAMLRDVRGRFGLDIGFHVPAFVKPGLLRAGQRRGRLKEHPEGSARSGR